MGVSLTTLEKQLDDVDRAIASVRAKASADMTIDQKNAVLKALEDLNKTRMRVIQMRNEARAAELAGLASAVAKSAADAERNRVGNILSALNDSINGAITEVVTTLAERIREIEADPVDAGTPVGEAKPPVVTDVVMRDPVIMRRTKTGQVVYGHLVQHLQRALIADGFDPKGADGYFGNDTEAALAQWHAATGSDDPSSLSALEWEVLTGLPIPDLFDLCAQVTAAFEGHGFTKAVGDFDGAIATWGYHGYTLKYGHLQKVLERTEAVAPGTLANALGNGTANQLKTMFAMSLDDQRAWGKANLLEPGGKMLSSWIIALDEIGNLRTCQEAQLAYSREAFWEKIALPQVIRLKLKDALSHAMLFDTAIQQGGLGETAMRQIEAEITANPDMPEESRRAAIARAAVASLKSGTFREDVRSRRETLIDGIGRVHGKTYNLSFWGLLAEFDENETRLDAVIEPDTVPGAFEATDFTVWFDANVKPHARDFSAGEFLAMGASNAPGKKCAGKNHAPPRELWENCIELAKVLQAFRNDIGSAVRILSCYRSPDYNSCVGGASMSQHKEFRAADIVVPAGGTPTKWRDTLIRLRDQGLFRGGIGTYGSFVHVDTRGENANWAG